MLRPLFFLLLLAGPAAAQAPLASRDTAAIPATTPLSVRSAADTVQAIHRLYARHRHIGAAFTLGALATDLTLAGISSAQEARDERHTSGGGGLFGGAPLIHFGFGGFAVIYAVLAAPVAAVGVQQLIAYGPKHEAKVLAQYKEEHTLPKRVARKLHRYLH